MAEEKTDIREVTIADDQPGEGQENAFDRLEARIDSLIERYEQLRGEHSRWGLELAEKEARIRELESELESLQHQKAEVRGRLDALIEKLSRFS
ncbi:MAG: cell division protein ZapB [Syntrophobacteria bacterium]